MKASEVKKEEKNNAMAALPAEGRGIFAFIFTCPNCASICLLKGTNEGKPLVNPLDLFNQLESVLPVDSVLVADGGDFVATGSYVSLNTAFG